MKISIVINCDTRPQRDVQSGLFSGVVNDDFLIDGVYNKIQFFNEFDFETIVFIDEHTIIEEKTLQHLRSIANCVVIRKHTNEPNFNDYNYLSALFIARGDIIAHFDQDTAAFTSSKEPIEDMISLLDQYKFVSYPSYWSPVAVHDESFMGKMWASTRFFMCKRETLKFDTLINCIKNPDWAYETFGDSNRRCNWLEHYLTLANDNSVYYPPIQTERMTIFTWETYEKYTLQRLNGMTYDEIFKWHDSHPIFYPNNVNA